MVKRFTIMVNKTVQQSEDEAGKHNLYDVIIVGGRAAGSTLAARLGMMGWRVLLLERGAMPSLPGASSPIINASTLVLLDEIGANEADYARDTRKIRRMIVQMGDMRSEMRLPTGLGRDYAYAIDRARFDGALFAHAATFPTVTARDNTSVLDLAWDEGRAAGVVVQNPLGERETLPARIVVGADGRFSLVARKAGAAESDVHDEHPTSLLYAYWQGVKPYDAGEATAVIYSAAEDGYTLLVMDSADDTTAVCIEGRADVLESAGKVQDFYLDLLQRNSPLAARLEGATQVGQVRGMKKVGNLYRQPGGAGWALVGDAYHQKDPADGQGIYDAVYTAKLLAGAIHDALAGRVAWNDALLRYDQEARAMTYPQYLSTMERIRASFYTSVPAWVSQLAVGTVMRWMMEDPITQEQFGRVMTREIQANEALPPTVALGALVRGPLRDFSRFLEERVINA